MSKEAILDIIIHSPFPRNTTQGNTVTADRLEQILTEDDYNIRMSAVNYNGPPAKCLIALNAWRSADMVKAYRAFYPKGKVIIIITGSDINNPDILDEHSTTRKTMATADALVMLHDIELPRLPKDLQQKCHVIRPSVALPGNIAHQPTANNGFEAIMSGNLRPVKNPYLPISAARLLPTLPESSGIHISSYGSTSGEIKKAVISASDELDNYQWHGQLPHEKMLHQMQHAHVLLNTSIGEGGANAICEAITMGLPVIASNIKGNKGMLGPDYAGYFPDGDEKALSAFLVMVATNRPFYEMLKEQIKKRAPLFTYAHESAQWLKLVKSII